MSFSRTSKIKQITVEWEQFVTVRDEETVEYLDFLCYSNLQIRTAIASVVINNLKNQVNQI